MAYEYEMVEVPPLVEAATLNDQAAADHLQDVVSAYAFGDWEFYRLDPVYEQRASGFWRTLLGLPLIPVTRNVITFRREIS